MMTMQEREVKIVDVDPQAVRDKLRKHEIDKKKEGEIQSRFYDFPDSRIEANGVLRLRQYSEESFVTYKAMNEQDTIKNMNEIEFHVDDLDATAAMFEALGLKEIRSSSKYREKWHDGEIEYVLDKYDEIPWVLEIEAPDEQQLEAAVTDLGYSMDETKAWDAADLFAAYDVE